VAVDSRSFIHIHLSPSRLVLRYPGAVQLTMISGIVVCIYFHIPENTLSFNPKRFYRDNVDNTTENGVNNPSATLNQTMEPQQTIQRKKTALRCLILSKNLLKFFITVSTDSN
jgi:hypothetical protein